MAVPDAELAEALLAMKGALNKVGNNVSQTARPMNDAKNRGQSLPFSQEDHAEMRHLAGMMLGFADEVALMADGWRSSLEPRISDELNNLAKRDVWARALLAFCAVRIYFFRCAQNICVL